MAESEPKDKIMGAALITPLETEITSECITLFARVEATDPITAAIAIEDYTKELGADETRVYSEREALSHHGLRKGRAFFSSSRWNASWEPTGPTPPWRGKPENN